MNNKILTLEDLLKMKITKPSFLLDPLLPKIGIAMLYGPSDSGKSFFCRQLSIAISNGDSDFLGYGVNPTHKAVLHLVTEEIDENSLGYKVHMQANGITSLNPSLVKYLIALKEPLQELERELSNNKYDLAIVDGWADTVIGDINQITVARKSTMHFRDLALKHSCCILLLHHVNKTGEENNPNKRFLSGSQGIEASVRSLFELRKGIGNGKVLTIVKGNDISDYLKEGHYFLETDDNMIYTMKGFEERGIMIGKPKKERFFDKPELCEAALALRKQGKSFEDIHQVLNDTFPDDSPGLTSIKNWFSKEGNAILQRDEMNDNRTQ